MYKILGLKDYKEAWDYQETLFKETIDIKIKNRRESADLVTPKLFVVCESPACVYVREKW